MSEEEKKFSIVETEENKYLIILSKWLRKKKAWLPSLEHSIISKNVLKEKDPTEKWMKIKLTQIHRFAGTYNTLFMYPVVNV